jgi:hypothetical protein
VAEAPEQPRQQAAGGPGQSQLGVVNRAHAVSADESIFRTYFTRGNYPRIC